MGGTEKMHKKSSSKKSSQNPKQEKQGNQGKQGKKDDPLKQYIVLDPTTMKTPPGRFIVVPIDTEDVANRMCWAIGLSAYADALKVFGRNKHALSVVGIAAEMATDTKVKHPELFQKEKSEGEGS
jgi:hypothetical protein